jgi:hypothetical protein
MSIHGSQPGAAEPQSSLADTAAKAVLPRNDQVEVEVVCIGVQGVPQYVPLPTQTI